MAARSPGTRRRGPSTSSRTGCWRSASAKGDAFAILAQTTLEWALFDFALGLVGAIGGRDLREQLRQGREYILDHSESSACSCEDEEQLAKIEDCAPNPRLEHVLTFADLDELRARGRDYAREHPNALRDAAARSSEDDLFTYIYTSGTTGPPKALHDPRTATTTRWSPSSTSSTTSRWRTTRCFSTSRSRTTSAG